MNEVKIGDSFSEGWKLYKDNMGICTLATLVAMLVSGVSCGICGGPLICGLFMILRRLIKKDDTKPTVGDVFKGFDVFLQAFLLCLIAGIGYFLVQVILAFIPIIGMLASFVLAWIYGPILIWSLMIVADRRVSWSEAIGLVLKETFNGKFTSPILLGILAGLIGGAGFILCGIGIFFTLPLAYCMYAVAYEQMFGSKPDDEPPQLETAP